MGRTRTFASKRVPFHFQSCQWFQDVSRYFVVIMGESHCLFPVSLSLYVCVSVSVFVSPLPLTPTPKSHGSIRTTITVLLVFGSLRSQQGDPKQKMFAEMEMRDDPERFPGVGRSLFFNSEEARTP